MILQTDTASGFLLPEARRVWWDLTTLFGLQALASLFSLAYLFLVSRALGPEGFGLVTLFLSIVHLAFNLSVNWGQSAMVRFGKEELLRSGRIAETFWARQVPMLSGLSIAGAVLLLGHGMIRQALGAAASATWALLLFLVVYSYADLGAWMLQTVGGIRRYAIGLVVRQLMLCIGGVLLVWGWIPPHFGAVVGVELVGYLGLLFAVGPAYARRWITPVGIRRDAVRALLRYSWPVFGSVIGGYLINWFHVGAVHHFLGDAEVGIYQVAYRLVFLMSEALGLISTVTFPLLMAAEIQGKTRFISEFFVPKLVPQISFLWGLATMGLIALAPSLVPLLFGQEYRPAVSVATLLLAGLSFHMVGVLYGVLFSTHDRLDWLMGIALLAGILNGLGMWTVIPRWGLMGAACISLACVVSTKIAHLWLGNRIVGQVCWRALVGPAITLAMVGAVLVDQRGGFRLPSFLILLFVALAWAKRLRLFQEADVVRFEPMVMPQLVRRGLKATYRWLS